MRGTNINDILLQFFIGGFESTFNKLILEQTNNTTLLNKLIKITMAIQEQEQQLDSAIADLQASIESERGSVKSALDDLATQITTLQSEVGNVNASSPALDKAIERVQAAKAAVESIYTNVTPTTPPVVAPPVDSTSTTPVVVPSPVVTPPVVVPSTIPVLGNTTSTVNLGTTLPDPSGTVFNVG